MSKFALIAEVWSFKVKVIFTLGFLEAGFIGGSRNYLIAIAGSHHSCHLFQIWSVKFYFKISSEWKYNLEKQLPFKFFSDMETEIYVQKNV